jgi:hypothetical protein
MTVIAGRLGKASHPCRAGRACRVEWPCGPAELGRPAGRAGWSGRVGLRSWGGRPGMPGGVAVWACLAGVAVGPAGLRWPAGRAGWSGRVGPARLERPGWSGVAGLERSGRACRAGGACAPAAATGQKVIRRCGPGTRLKGARKPEGVSRGLRAPACRDGPPGRRTGPAARSSRRRSRSARPPRGARRTPRALPSARPGGAAGSGGDTG